jgi:serine/threonine protein kinase
MPGGSLASLIKMFGPLSENLIKKYLKQILEALKYIHSKGIVHRQIKAANILLNSDGVIKLSDFGNSGNLDYLFENIMINNTNGRSPLMKIENQSGYKTKDDIWSLGFLLIELTTGEVPCKECDNLTSAMLKIDKTEFIPIIPDIISPELKNFISQCLEKDPLLRPEADTLCLHPFLN